MKYIALVVISLMIVSCNGKKSIVIQLIPCLDERTYKHQGNLHGKYVIFYYVVITNAVRSEVLDSLEAFVRSQKQVEKMSHYAHVTLRFFADKEVLRNIQDCKTAEEAQLKQSRHLKIADYAYDSTSKALGKVLFDKKGKVVASVNVRDSLF